MDVETESRAAPVAAQFERVWPWLAAALSRDVATHSKADIAAMIEAGEAQLWPGERCALVTVVNDFPKAKLCTAWLAGGDLREIQELAPRIEAWARAQGCTHARIAGRKGWLRTLHGYRHTATLSVKEL